MGYGNRTLACQITLEKGPLIRIGPTTYQRINGRRRFHSNTVRQLIDAGLATEIVMSRRGVVCSVVKHILDADKNEALSGGRYARRKCRRPAV